MKETSKATERRLKDKSFRWGDVFTGHGIDVGSGDDALASGIFNIESVKTFDTEDGNAETLPKYFKGGEFDFLHASQVLEHMRDPESALNGWLYTVVKGGHLVITVPDYDLYENRIFPSRFNPDHKSTWSLWRKEVWNSKQHIYVPTFLRKFAGLCDVKRCELITTNYPWKNEPKVHDYTFNFEDRVECFIEFVLQRI